MRTFTFRPLMRNDNNLTSNMHLLSVAPMMDWTDRHERAFLRVISKRTLLYTEMVTTGAILHGDRDRLLAFDASEHPVALRSEEHTSELQSLMRSSYAVFCLNKKK